MKTPESSVGIVDDLRGIIQLKDLYTLDCRASLRQELDAVLKNTIPVRFEAIANGMREEVERALHLDDTERIHAVLDKLREAYSKAIPPELFDFFSEMPFMPELLTKINNGME